MSKVLNDIWQDALANRRAYFMASCACWGGMLFGWDTGLIGGILPRASFKKSFGLDVDAAAYADLSGWIVSVLQAGCFFGAMSTAWFSERFGRKTALFVAAFWFILGSILQTVPALGSQSSKSALNQLYVGRAIGGYGVGMVSTVVPTYVSESAPKHLRGRMTGMYQLFIVTGIALSFWVNYGLLQQFGEDANKPQQWRIAFGLQLIPGVLLVLSMLTQYESPRWLIEHGHTEKAQKVIAHLRGVEIDSPIVQEEVNGIIDDARARPKLTLVQQAKECCRDGRTFYRSSLPFILMFWQQWTGVNSMNYYSPVIFQELGMKGASATLLGTGIYGIVKIVMTVLTLALGIEQFGRKSVLFWGGLGQSLCMFYIGAYKKIHTDATDVVPASYVAIVAIYLYVTFYSFGWSVAPWPAMSESVPNNVRSLTMSIGLMSNWLFNFTISKITPILLNKITYGTYLLFACTTLAAVLWTLFLYPETGGYAIEDIHQLFEGNLVAQSLHDNKYIFSRVPRRNTAAANREVVAQSQGSDEESQKEVMKGEEEYHERR